MMGLGEGSERRRRTSDVRGEDTASDDPLDSHHQRQGHHHAPPANSPMPRHAALEDPPAPRQNPIHPLIRVLPEYKTLYRKDPTGQNGKQNMVCVISVEVPSRRPPLSLEEEEAKHRMQWRGLGTIHDGEDDLNEEDGREHELNEHDEHAEHEQQRHLQASGLTAPSEHNGHHSSDIDEEEHNDGDMRAGRKESESGHPPSAISGRSSSPGDEGFSFGATPAAGEGGPSDPFTQVFEDLKTRIADWKGQPIEKFGKLVLYEYLGVRQESVVRNFWVYLFHSALLCITEERRKERGLARLMGGNNDRNGNGHMGANGPLAPNSNGPKPALKLKGRIWLRHVTNVEESSSRGQHSLSIKLDDESLDSFVLCFPEKNLLDNWKAKLMDLVEQHRPGASKNLQVPPPLSVTSSSGPSEPSQANNRHNLRELPSFRAATDPSSHEMAPPNNRSNLARRTSGSASVMSGKAGSSTASNGGLTSPAVSSFSANTVARKRSISDSIRRSSRMFSGYSQGLPTQQQWSGSGGLDPGLPPPALFPHTPLDLVLMVSVPAPAQQQPAIAGRSSTAALKLRLIRSTLEFVASHMGPRDRIAIVAYMSGPEGEVRRTALLNVNRDRSRAKLAEFIDGIGKVWDQGEDDPYRVDSHKLGGASDRTDTVTALNVGLDVVLGRRGKNPCTSMILINDTPDGPVRGQMDLVMARAEAANVPIHCFGFTKSSNPSSLWLISNHTRGSYTFVREWFQLRECVAGCIGSMMSVALDQVKLHISVPGDNHFRVRKVAGQPSAIVSASGKDIDIEIGDLRFGEVRELFVELELDFNGLVPFITHHNSDGGVGVKRLPNAPGIEPGSATDEFIQRMGFSNLSLLDSSGDLFGGEAIESLIEEVAVFEVDAGFRDPALNSSVTRLSNPTILTMEVDASAPDADAKSPYANLPADPVVTRRRIEILVSDMITRALLLVSRKNHSQALRIVNETHKIVETVLKTLSTDDVIGGGGGPSSHHGHGFPSSTDRRSSLASSVSSPTSANGPGRNKASRSAPARQRALQQRQAAASLLAIIDDLELMADGLQEGETGRDTNPRALFDRDGRNSAAQQAMVLRDQQAWTTRTTTEALRFTSDNGPAYAALAFSASRA